MTLTFKLVRARDQTRLPCEFGANPFSGFRDISYTQKSYSTNYRTFRSLLCVVISANLAVSIMWLNIIISVCALENLRSETRHEDEGCRLAKNHCSQCVMHTGNHGSQNVATESKPVQKCSLQHAKLCHETQSQTSPAGQKKAELATLDQSLSIVPVDKLCSLTSDEGCADTRTKNCGYSDKNKWLM